MNFHVDHFLDAGTMSRGAEEDCNSDCCLRQHSTVFNTFSLFSPRLLACALKKEDFFLARLGWFRYTGDQLASSLSTKTNTYG